MLDKKHFIPYIIGLCFVIIFFDQNREWEEGSSFYAYVAAILFFSRKHLTSTACSMGFFLHLLGRIDHGVQASGVVNGALLVHSGSHAQIFFQTQNGWARTA
ncbi:MAG: hypothetical protein WCJ30_11165, partial [Deltaproteobacteria bacterium]